MVASGPDPAGRDTSSAGRHSGSPGHSDNACGSVRLGGGSMARDCTAR